MRSETSMVTVTVVIQQHLDHLAERRLSAETIAARRGVLSRLWIFLGKPPIEARPDDLDRWRASLRLSDVSYACYLSHVRAFYRWAARRGLIESNPAEHLSRPLLPRPLPRPIGEDALLYALAGAPARIRPWLVLAGWAGLRAKEIALLRRRNVLDRAQPPVLVIVHDATKGQRERAVPMSDFVLSELRPVLPASGWVFRRVDGQPGPNKPYHISHLANDYLHDAGITETLHQLRHRFLSQAYERCQDLRVVQELAGHASPVTTAGYTKFSDQRAVAAVQAVPAPGLRAVR